MATPLTVEDILPLIATLPPQERVRLIRLMALQPLRDEGYGAAPPTVEEFSTDEELLSWEGEDWVEFY